MKVTVLIIANTLNLGATILHLLITKRHEFSYFCGLMFRHPAHTMQDDVTCFLLVNLSPQRGGKSAVPKIAVDEQK